MSAPLSPAAQNAADFQAEWVTLCGQGQELARHTVAVHCPYEALARAVKAVLAAHGAIVCEAAPEYCVAVDAAPPESAAKTLAIYTAAFAGDSPQRTETWCVLRTPSLYGAGLPAGCGIDISLPEHKDAPALHVVDLLRLLLTKLAAFTPGVWEISGDDAAVSCGTEVSREEQETTLWLLREYPDRRFYDDTTYGGALHELQQLQLKCLLELDRVCRQNGIQYFLGGGTLLGAVRHGGFIPWDDDVDVMMTRENFDRLAKVAPASMGEDFFFQNSTTDPWYHSPFAKIRLRGTRFVTEFSSQFPKMHNEVFIDIFAHDAAPKCRRLVKPHIFVTKFARSMVFHKWGDTPMHFYGRLNGLCRVMSAVKKHCSIARLEAFERRVMTFWNKKSTGFLYDGMGEHMDHGRFDASILDEATEAMFEGHPFPIPRRYEEYLRFSYGDDYMCWPRPGARRSHHSAVEFSLGDHE